MREPEVQKCVVAYLSAKGWSKNLVSKKGKEHGVDIKVSHKKYARYWEIEVKGEASEKAKHPRSHREVNFILALGQIITRMHTNRKRNYKYGYKYGVAYPVSFRDLVIRRLPFDVCDKLNLYVFFVDDSGQTEVLGWKELKSFQKNNV